MKRRFPEDANGSAEDMYTELPPGGKDSHHMENGDTTPVFIPPGKTLHILGRKINSISLVTHLLVLAYAMCVFIQGSTMPVSIILHLI